MTKVSRVVVRYSTCFKQKVVKEIEEEGLSYQQASLRYNIKGGQTVQNWIKKYGKNHLLNTVIRVEMKGEKDELKRLKDELKKFKEAYAELSLKYQCSEKIIEIANEELQTDFKKKNFGTGVSKDSRKNTQ